MTGQPPRPDEGDLARFHNGDTLDNIPIVQLPQSDEPLRWRRVPLFAVVVLGAAVIGGLASVGILTLVDGDGHERTDRAAGGVHTPANSALDTPSSASSSPEPTEDPSTPAVEPKAAALEQVRVIQTPSTGGDAGASFCLVYTGSYSGAERDAILLLEPPAYQCQDMLPVDRTGQRAPLVTEAPVCEPPSRAAVLSFAETGGWEDEVMYTCLSEHRGA
ncbi:hypothetical protein [Streptomyces endophyticus]|uniref:Serine/threonine protein kinase n=1 Tax=Streptomyces endophyticus TaxID=714166 RepID=A0ABU6F235_9ACTN|nr:hypothetical protein [Streptomyces endophyticus]MEB8338061.1 hypothetical protein [Streptomyces endophyticus]